MRKLISAIATAAAVLALSCMSAFAAPITMPDGNMFDPEFYASKYPDVVRVYGTDPQALYLHYTSFGEGERRLPYAGAKLAPLPITEADYGKVLLDLINENRKGEGLNTLNYAFELADAAKFRSNELTVLYSYDRPDGNNYSKVLPYWCENDPRHAHLIMKDKETPAEVLSAWLSKEETCKVLRDSQYNQGGIAFSRGEDGTPYYAMLLAYRKP